MTEGAAHELAVGALFVSTASVVVALILAFTLCNLSDDRASVERLRIRTQCHVDGGAP